MQRPLSGRLAAGVLAVLLALATSGWVHPEAGRIGSPEVAPVEVWVVGMPRLVSPGTCFVVSWWERGLSTFTEAGVEWDTVSHQHDNAYRYTALSMWPKLGKDYARIVVPLDANEIFFKAYFISEGTTYRSEPELSVKCERLVNVGTDSWREDSLGRTWEPDADWGAGVYGYVGGETYLDNSEEILGTEDAALYWSQRIGLSSYHFYTGTGAYEADYEVELHFVELQKRAVGERVFSVSIEGVEKLHDFDIYREVGFKTACIRTFQTKLRDGSLDIEFTGTDPLLCAVRVRGIRGIPQFESHSRVQGSLDDTYVHAGSANPHHDENIRLGGGQYDGGMRFVLRNIDHGSLIREARLHTRVYSSSSADVSLTIYAENTDDAANFIGSNPLVPYRPRTGASVPWDIEESWIADTWIWAPDVKDVIQEVVDRPGWTRGNGLVLLFIASGDDGGYRDLCASDAGADAAAWLYTIYVPAEYVPMATATITPTPTQTAMSTSTPMPSLTPTAKPSPTLVLSWMFLPLIEKP